MWPARVRNSSWSRAGDLAHALKKTALAHSAWANRSRRKASIEVLLLQNRYPQITQRGFEPQPSERFTKIHERKSSCTLVCVSGSYLSSQLEQYHLLPPLFQSV